MRRTVSMLAVIALVVAGFSALAQEETKSDPHLVEGTRVAGKNVWRYKGEVTTPAAIGKAAGRLEVRVKKGDMVRFEVPAGAQHADHKVLFEQGKAEQGTKWEVVAGSGTLIDIPGNLNGFDPKAALESQAKHGPLVTIRILDLMAGPDNGILFACDPHSGMGPNPMSRAMLGVIVLDEGAEKKGEYKDKPSR